MRRVDIFLAIFIWGLLHCATSDNEDRISVLEKHILTLDRKVEKLESDTIERNDVIRILALSLAELTDNESGNTDNSDDNSGKGGNSSGNEKIDEEEGKDDSVSPVTFTEVRREVQGSKVKFSVKYKPDVEEYTILWLDRFELVANYSDVPLSDGLRETSILVEPPAKTTEGSDEFSQPFHPSVLMSSAGVTFSHPNGEGVFLLLRNGQEDAVERSVTLPVLKAEPERELVYDDGDDVIFKLSTPILKTFTENDGYPFRSTIEFHSFLRNPDTGRLVVKANLDEEIMAPLGNETFSDHQEWKIKIKTSVYKTSGVILISTNFDSEEETSLVMGSTCNKFLVLRPSTQAGPFPHGYVDVVRNQWATYTEDGALQTSCGPDIFTICEFKCPMVGNDITQPTVYMLEGDDVLTPVDNLPGFRVTHNPTHSKYMRATSVSYPSNFTTDTLRFRCQASNAEGGTGEQDIEVVYIEPISFVRNDSEVQILHKNETLVELKLMCKVKGKPQPNVTFTLSTYSSYDYNLEPDEVISSGENEITAVKDLSYDPMNPYITSNNHQSKLRSAECSASSDQPYYDYANFVFIVPNDLP